MPLTPAEKQKRYRDRLKEAKKMAPDRSVAFMKRPLSDLYTDSFNFEEPLDALGFENRAYFGDPIQTFESGSEASYSGATALERLTGLAGVFLDAAVELHEFINRYKLDEVDARISELKARDLSDPTARQQALDEIVQLNEIRAQLDREFRRSFREINVKGTPST